MKTIASLPVFEVEFDKNAKLFSAAQLTELQDHVKNQGVTDLHRVRARLEQRHGGRARSLHALLHRSRQRHRQGRHPGASPAASSQPQ